MKKFIKSLFIVVGFLTMQLSLAENALSDINGKVATYYEDGSKKADKQYKNGIPIGFWESWHKDGSPHTIINFLGNTGQIEKIEARYPSGALMYKGVASIRSRKEENKETMIYFGECSARATMKGNGDKWYNKYELKFSSFYEDGSCEKTAKDSIYRAITQLYIRLNDVTTGETYDFPWNKLWGTVPSHLRKK